MTASKPLDHLARGAGPEAHALVVGGETLTYGELDEGVGRMAGQLLAMGLKAGDRVATWGPKHRITCLMPLAAARAGLVHVPINPVLKAGQAAHILKDSGAALLLANKARFDTLGEGPRTAAFEAWEESAPAMEPSEHAPETLAALMYTSGSTGRPKGVMLSHANLWLGADSVQRFLELGNETRSLCLLPLAFDFGQNNMLAAWRAGGVAIAADYLLPNDVKKLVRMNRATFLGAVPPLWHQIAKLDWSCGSGVTLDTIANSGGHVAEPLYRTLRETFPKARIHLMYGLTEAFRAASLDPRLADTHPDSVGTAIPHAELMVVREDGSECEAGEEGELVQAGPLVTQGYWQRPEETAKRFRPAPAQSRLGGTAVWSGDRMVRGEDGLLYFRARGDAMLKVSGNRLSPGEVEEMALASGVVSEAVALGRADETLGHAIVLHVVGTGDEDALRAHFRREAPSYMMPAEIVWHEALPTGATGKVDRVRLAEAQA
ncbi:AMP-binding protein [Sphingomicrobium nitratireducens]|uniref:AMP-binding protein n=1 Tax=Sphingomicrobium nitratireducens TaxID=2964666 RepID=UPI002240DB68|nr:AMP-binding protein [Sphingomicrobium nitratireducens]